MKVVLAAALVYIFARHRFQTYLKLATVGAAPAVVPPATGASPSEGMSDFLKQFYGMAPK